jgi:hypothetical protein
VGNKNSGDVRDRRETGIAWSAQIATLPRMPVQHTMRSGSEVKTGFCEVATGYEKGTCDDGESCAARVRYPHIVALKTGWET